MTHAAAPPGRPPEPDGPRQVSRFEFNLLRILRAFFGQHPADQAVQMIRAAMARPECLSPAAVALIQDHLAKGCVLFLVREGGWRNDRYLRAGQPVGGRVWDRIPLDERVLEFSAHVVEFLLWITAEKAHETKVSWDDRPDERTPADELFFWRVFDACRGDSELVPVLRAKAAFRQNPLCWLTFPGDMADSDEPAPPDFRPCFTGLRAVMLECLQTHFTRRWTDSERRKGQIDDWRRMRTQGRAELATLRAFLEAADVAGRPDLARFVLRANVALFHTELTPVFWTGGLRGTGPARLADRLDTQRSALAVPRQMEALEAWQQRARSVGYFDDGYQASQMWKEEWEAADGDQVAARARHAVEMLEPLRGPAPQKPPPDAQAAGENPEGSPG